MIDRATLEDKPVILTELDRLIDEMVKLRTRVAAGTIAPSGSSKNWEAFGMWADRQDMQNLSSVEWLEQLCREQWRSRLVFALLG